jgi:hypothetical protein
MRPDFIRETISVVRLDGAWAVEHGGDIFGHSPDKEVAQAFAHKRAREVQAAGRPCQMRVHGEHGYAGSR